MRQAIIEEIYKIMAEDKNVYFLTGDLGYNALESIEKDFPKRFINVGVAEQNMIGIASGLALSGKKVYIYSIIPFLIMRCFEQVRNDICYHNLDVTFLGIGSGFSYGILGSTHYALEDVAVLRPLPNISIFSPCDEVEAVLGVRALRNYHRPVYLRIGERQEPKIYDQPYDFVFGRGKVLREGKETVILASGVIMSEVLAAAKMLWGKNKISAAVINIHTLKPLDKNLIFSRLKQVKKAFTVEEHGVISGLGSAVCEVVAEHDLKVKVVRIGGDNELIKIVGTRSYLRRLLGLDALGIYRKISSEFR